MGNDRVPHPPPARAGGADHHAAFAKAALIKEKAALSEQARKQSDEIGNLETRLRKALKELAVERHEHAQYLAISQMQQGKLAALQQSIETKQKSSESAATAFRAKAASTKHTIVQLEKQVERGIVTNKDKDAKLEALKKQKRDLETDLRDIKLSKSKMSLVMNENKSELVSAQSALQTANASLYKDRKQLKYVAEQLKRETSAASKFMAEYAKIQQELATATAVADVRKNAVGQSGVVQELEQLKEERAGFTSQIASLQADLAKAEMELHSVTSQLERSNSEQARYHKDSVTRGKQASELRSKLASEVLERNRIKNELLAKQTSLAKTVQLLEKKAVRLHQNIEEQTKTLDMLKQSKTDLTGQIRALDAQQRQLAASVKISEAEVDRQHALRQKVEIDAKRVKGVITELEARSSAADRKAGVELRNLLLENRNLEAQLENVTERLTREKDHTTSEANSKIAAEQQAATIAQKLRAEADAHSKAKAQIEIESGELARETKLRMAIERSLRNCEQEVKSLKQAARSEAKKCRALEKTAADAKNKLRAEKVRCAMLTASRASGGNDGSKSARADLQPHSASRTTSIKLNTSLKLDPERDYAIRRAVRQRHAAKMQTTGDYEPLEHFIRDLKKSVGENEHQAMEDTDEDEPTASAKLRLPIIGR